MCLVDTSVWIDYFRGKENGAAAALKQILDQGTPFGITGIVYQEVLQGVGTAKDFRMLETYLSTQRFYHMADRIQSYRDAADIYFRCRKKGITIRSTVDCLIAQISIENELELLHNDQDFVQISQVIPGLKLLPLQHAG